MKKYIRLLRLEDQYPVFGGAIAAGVYLGVTHWWILLWAVAATFISIGTYIVNELIDSQDVDKWSKNRIHIAKNQPLNMFVAWGIYGLCTITGLWIAWSIGLLVWAVAMAMIGAAYSLWPFRFKTIFLVDIVSQIVVWWVIPFSAPLWQQGMLAPAFSLIVSAGFLAWAIVFPYQLIDYFADKKTGFHNTHVVLGVNRSLLLGMIFVFVGIGMFFWGGGLIKAPWLGVFGPLAIVTVVQSVGWMGISSLSKKEQAMQRYVGWMKPLTQLLIPYILLLWLWP